MWSSLDSLRWHVLRVSLANTRNQFAREPPFAIFEAIGHAAARAAHLRDHDDWFFHPRGQPFGSRVRRGGRYALEFVFPRADAAAVTRFRDGLSAHLDDPKNNFEIESLGEPLPRRLADITQETAALDDAGNELCLDFLTPLAFPTLDSKRRWHVETATLIHGLLARVARLGARVPNPPASAWAGVRVVPCYWHYEEHQHASKSKGGRYLINGCAGPLYLKGDSRPLLPLLRLGQEWHAGDRVSFGQGAYALRLDKAFFLGNLANPQLWREVFDELAAEQPGPDAFLHPLGSVDEMLEQLVADVREGRWQPTPARGFTIEKPSPSPTKTPGPSGVRTLADLPSRDRLVHRVAHRLLQPAFDRLFESTSHGFRPGRSVRDARDAVLAAVRDGCAWVVETDIATCFDSLDWSRLDAAVAEALPRADTVMRDLVGKAIRQPLELAGGAVVRTRGVLQGSPLSPLLTNLYLDPFDEACYRAGLRLVRYADDFLVLCRDESAALEALETVTRVLGELGLSLKTEKTAITPVGAGFQFLGQSFEAELDGEFLEKTTLKRPAHVAADYSFVGIDGDALVVRRDGALAARIPLRRVSEIILHGAHGVSTPLLMACTRQSIPVSLCSAAGWHLGTLRPDDRRQYALAGEHASHHASLSDGARVALAREVATTKIENYLAWMREQPEPDPLPDGLPSVVATAAHLDGVLDGAEGDFRRPALAEIRRMECLLVDAAQAESTEAVLGYEGMAARLAFRWVNRRVRIPEFHSSGREPRRKRDRWNVLLDFTYSRLFARLNVLVRSRGLNPWLGFLHSAAAPFESLVCDLQEPFRARCDRWALRVVNRRQVRPAEFLPDSKHGWRLDPDAWRRLAALWEEELDTRWSHDPGTWEQLLHAQVEAVREWATGKTQVRLYRVLGGRQPRIGSDPRPPDSQSHGDPG